MEEVKEEAKGPIMSKTKGGLDCIIANGMSIRKSSSPRRLIEDDETYEEYKVRLKLIKQIAKEKQLDYLWVSKFNIKGQNYTATYNKKVVEKIVEDKKLKLKGDEASTRK